MIDFEIVKSEIDKLDIVGLLKIGAPQDEYDVESTRISKLLLPQMTVQQAAYAMSRVFSNSFGKEFKKEDFLQAAHAVLQSVRLP